MTAADDLRRAAARIREVAAKAPSGPWTIKRPERGYPLRTFVVAPDAGVASTFDSLRPTETAEHIALFHPGVAVLVADILDAWARIASLDPDLLGRVGGDEALAVAKAINGGDDGA